MYIIKSNEYSIKQFFIVLFVILLSKSLYYESYGTNILLIPFLIFLLLLNYKKKLILSKKLFIFSMFFFFLASINPEAKTTSLLVLLISLTIGTLVVKYVDFYIFTKIFNKIIIILSIFSLFYWLVITYNIHSFLPSFIGIDERELRNFIFFGVSNDLIKYQSYRNSGLWWEPGAFNLFVILAFIFSILNKTLNKKLYFLFALVIITIQSTTGLISFAMLSMIFFIRIVKKSKNKIFYLQIFSIVTTIFMFILLPIILNKFDATANSYVSFLSRYYDIKVSTNMFLDNFLVGYGFGSQVENAIPYGIDLLGSTLYESIAKPTGSDGITMLIAQCGLLSFIILYPFFFPKYFYTLYKYEKILISIVLFIIFNTENFTFLLIFIILLFYGILGQEKKGLRK